jgi:hypothetical protein
MQIKNWAICGTLGLLVLAGCATQIPSRSLNVTNPGATDKPQAPTYRLHAVTLPEDPALPRPTVVALTADDVRALVTDMFRYSAALGTIDVQLNTLATAKQSFKLRCPQFIDASMIYIVKVQGDDLLWPFAGRQYYGNGTGGVGGATPLDGNKVIDLVINPEDGRTLAAKMPKSTKRGT